MSKFNVICSEQQTHWHHRGGFCCGTNPVVPLNGNYNFGRVSQTYDLSQKQLGQSSSRGSRSISGIKIVALPSRILF